MVSQIASNIVPIITRLYQEAGLELLIVPLIVVAVLVHRWGSRTNRRIAQAWMDSHAAMLRQEYALVGFRTRQGPTVEEVESSGLAQATLARHELEKTEHLLKESSAREFRSYATGRQNVAFTDFKLSLYHRYNPVGWMGERVISLFFESLPAMVERMEAISYPFDGKEKDLVPAPAGKSNQYSQEQRRNSPSSTFDGFVWAVVHKDGMKRLRDERFDLSITITKDHSKLPAWTTIMSESGEITEALLTDGLVEAIKAAGPQFEYLIISDQPLEKPTKLEDIVPKKRVELALRLPSSPSGYQSSNALFAYFLRIPDQLVSSAHFRPEVTRKIRQTRDEHINRLQRAEEEEKAGERQSKRDKERKEKREATLKGLSAEEQRKFLERERDKSMRKTQKKMTQRG
ncbi:MAG: hypothetical protein M1823_004421 [Watsoniomyces obsoletus]|nr:MAG: hypothetical protein M1823_004421 [Watsoniomyces obsoletus]